MKLGRPSATGMQPAVLVGVIALMCSCSHLQGAAACPYAQSATVTSRRHLTASAGQQVRHLLQLAPVPTPAAVSTASATSTASSTSSATASATAASSSSPSGDTGEYPSFGECQTAAAAFVGAEASPGGRRLLMRLTRGHSSRTRSLLNMQDYFRGAVTAANASGAAFGSPDWQNTFIASCASQASGSTAPPGGRRPHAVVTGR